MDMPDTPLYARPPYCALFVLVQSRLLARLRSPQRLLPTASNLSLCLYLHPPTRYLLAHMSHREPMTSSSTERRNVLITKVFYMIFVEHELISPKNPVVLGESYENDGFVGCISGFRISPPHTVNSLKRAICKAEQISDAVAYDVYETIIEYEPLDAAQRLVMPYPGTGPDDPLLLVKASRHAGNKTADSLSRQVVSGRDLLAPLATLHGHTDWVYAVAISPDGLLIASASKDRTIRISDVASTTWVSLLQGHTESVTSVAFSPDSTQVVSGSGDKTARIWDVSTWTCKRTLEGHSDWVRSVTFSPNGTLVATGSDDKEIKIWDAELGTSNKRFLGHKNYVRSVAFSPDGSRLVSGSRDCTLRTWDVGTTTCLMTAGGFPSEILSVAWSPCGTLIASGTVDPTVQVRSVTSGAALGVMREHTGSVNSVVFSPDGFRIASASVDRTIRIWETDGESNGPILHGHTDTVMSVAFSPDGALLVSGSKDKTVCIWNVEDELGDSDPELSQ